MFNVNKKIFDQIKIYCDLNLITDIDKFCNELLESAFTTKKYGEVPEFVFVKKEGEKPPENNEQIPEEEVKVIPEKKQFKKLNTQKDDYKIYDEFG